MVKMLDGMTDEQRAALIRKLTRKYVFRLQQRHFGFADLQHADDGGLDKLLSSFDTAAWLEALHGAGDVLLRTFVNRMGADAGRKFLMARDAMATPSDRTVKAARKAILIKAYILRDQGGLTVSIPGESDFV